MFLALAEDRTRSCGLGAERSRELFEPSPPCADRARPASAANSRLPRRPSDDLGVDRLPHGVLDRLDEVVVLDGGDAVGLGLAGDGDGDRRRGGA